MATSSRSRLDEWSLTGPQMTFSNQELMCAHKGKNSAFGRSIVRSGRAEWDIELNFQTFGGITLGVYRTKSSTTGNDDDPEYVASMPLEASFTDSETGYGYTNRTGKFVSGGSSQEYAEPFGNGDVVTIRLDLTSSTLSFSKNGVDQGSVRTTIARGAYRLAAKMQFAEQKITIKRFWTSLMDEGGQAENEVLDKIHNWEDEEEKAAEAAGLAAMAEETKDEDMDFASEPYPTNGSVGGAAASPRMADRSQSEVVDRSEQVPPPELDRRYSLDDLRTEIEHQRRSVSEVEILPLVETPKSDKLPAQSIPEHIRLTKTEESSDIFLVAGKNLKADKTVVTCVRGGDNEHSAFGAQVVSRGIQEWVLKIEGGRGVIVGIAANTLGWDSNFTDFVGSFGYGDDGYKYSEGNIEEYSSSYVPGDHIIIRLDMIDRTLTFIREAGDGTGSSEEKEAFTEIPLDTDDLQRRSSLELGESAEDELDDGAITGYRLAVCMKHRNSKISIVSSATSHVQQYSPRYRDEEQMMTFQSADPHTRKASWPSVNLVDQRPEKVLMPGTPSSSSLALDDDVVDEDEAPPIVLPEEKEVQEATEEAKEPSQPAKSPKPEGRSQSRGGKTRGTGKGGRAGKTDRRGGKTDRSSGRGGKRDRTTGARAGRRKDQELPRKAPPRAKSPGGQRLKDRRDQAGRIRGTRSPARSPRPRTRPSKRRTPGPDMTLNEEELGPVRFVKTAQSEDRWFKAGPKIRLERATAQCRQDAPNGQSAFGHFVIEGGRIKWDVRMDAGENFAIGISSSTEAIRKMFPQTLTGYAYYSTDGGVMNNGNYQTYGEGYRSGDVISVKLDAVHHTLSFSKNGQDQGVAFRNIPAVPYRLAVMIYNRRHTVSIKRVTVWEAHYS